MTKSGYLFFFVGRIASGKETQSRLLAEKLGYDIFSTGMRFRELAASGTELGNRIKSVYEKGLLMPAWVANFMFQNYVFNLPQDKGAVFEGSGRDVEQAKVIEEVCAWLERPYAILNLEISEGEVMKRSLLRARDKTDTEEVVKMRLAEYKRLTEPAIEYFRSIGKCIEINGELTPDGVHGEVMAAVERITR